MSITTLYEKGIMGDFAYQAMGISCTGSSHFREGKENQDSVAFAAKPQGIMLAVADGVGSCKKAKAGSSQAIDSSRELFDAILNGSIRMNAGNKIKDFLVNDWLSKIGIPEEHGTTLKFVVMTDLNILAGGIGDGSIFVSLDGKGYCFQDNADLFSNFTYSLGDDIDLKRLTLRRITLPPFCRSINIFIGTDGITTELQRDREMEFLNYLASSLRENSRQCKKEILDWIGELQSKNGDDKTVLIFVAERNSA